MHDPNAAKTYPEGAFRFETFLAAWDRRWAYRYPLRTDRRYADLEVVR
jgi:hypothetical protein